MPEEEEDEAEEEEPPVILVDELKPIPLNCSEIKCIFLMYYFFVIILQLFIDKLYRYKYLIARFSIFVHWI